MRQGYDLRTAIRFGDRPDEDQCLRCDAVLETGQRIAELVYAQAATIWRVNFGWNRRKNENEIGFELDIERARWIPNEQAQTLRAETPDEPARRVMRVVPFVEDRRNALMFRWVGSEATAEQMAGLQAALKSAIQAVFQLEDSELAAEPLPTSDDRRFLLFYEAAEGGAGVLRRLVEDPAAMRLVARKALELCHYNADDLTDLGRGPRAREDCSTACYDCLLSYGNQRDHLLLDRRLMPEMLSSLRDAKFETSTGTKSRSQKMDDLLGQCDSELERKWLRLVYENNLTLPSYAQYRIEECRTRPDFVYVHGANKLAVYIDGPPHDYPARQMRDAEQDIALLGQGWVVQRFHHEGDWMALFSQFPGIYGGQA
jgi:very-short-patch-repair endonuclease